MILPLVHVLWSDTSCAGGRGNFGTAACGEVNYWGSDGPTHIPTEPQMLFGDWEQATCPDCILAKLGNLP